MKTQRAKSLITFHFARESSNDMMSYQRNSNDRTVTGIRFILPTFGTSRITVTGRFAYESFRSRHLRQRLMPIR